MDRGVGDPKQLPATVVDHEYDRMGTVSLGLERFTSTFQKQFVY